MMLTGSEDDLGILPPPLEIDSRYVACMMTSRCGYAEQPPTRRISIDWGPQ